MMRIPRPIARIVWAVRCYIAKIRRSPIVSLVPGSAGIDLVAYYPQYIEYYERCELQTKQWCVEQVQKDWCVIDCGANVGIYTLLFSRLVPFGEVHAIEPTTTVNYLKANVNYAGASNVYIHNVAVGISTGEIEDRIYRLWGRRPEVQTYQFMTVDDFIFSENIKRVDCIKIDVDSYDYDVLRGAVKTLRDHNPWVIVELNHALNKRGQSNMQALCWLKSQGYTEALVLDDENFIFKKSAQNSCSGSGPEFRLKWL